MTRIEPTAFESLQTRGLFGGAISLGIPSSFLDVSDKLPIPDHQEVFADSENDRSFIVEINERSDVDDSRCGQFYFANLASDNESTSYQVASTEEIGADQVPGITPWHHGSIASGTQVVSKARQGPECANEVKVLLAVLRLPQQTTDILLTLNAPTFINAASSSAEVAGSGPRGLDDDATRDLFLRVLGTFRIVDYSLFG